MSGRKSCELCGHAWVDGHECPADSWAVHAAKPRPLARDMSVRERFAMEFTAAILRDDTIPGRIVPLGDSQFAGQHEYMIAVYYGIKSADALIAALKETKP